MIPVSVLVFLNVLNTIKSVCLLPFPDVSVTNPSVTLTLIWLTVVSIPESVNAYCTPYCTSEVVPSTTLCSVKGVLANCFVMVLFTLPFTRICIFSFVNVLFAKYLSVTLNDISAVFASTFTDEDIFSTNGSTTSTNSSSLASPPGKLIPEVIVVAVFPLPAVSIILSAGIATVTTPL